VTLESKGQTLQRARSQMSIKAREDDGRDNNEARIPRATHEERKWAGGWYIHHS